MSVRTGLDRLVADDFRALRGQRVGLVTHPAAVDRHYRSAAELFHSAEGVHLVALFGPEHGLSGYAQDLEGTPPETAEFPGVQCFSLYGHSVATLRPAPAMLHGLDRLVIDLVDVGARYYTFQATMLYCLEAAAAAGLPVLILDRPNPLGGVAVEGPTIQPGYESFVGVHPICTQHGMTIGELARLYVHERGLNVALEVHGCENWDRQADFGFVGLPWVMPSPNMPTLKTACVYPGMCLIEGTNLSEGRGTTRPFEIVGAPGIRPDVLASDLNGVKLPGVYFRPLRFKPTFQKHVGQICGGVQLHLTDRAAFHPVRTGLAVLAALMAATGEHFAWRTEEYEFVTNPIAIDLLFGSDRERRALDDRADWRDLASAWEPEEREFRSRRQPFLLYE